MGRRNSQATGSGSAMPVAWGRSEAPRVRSRGCKLAVAQRDVLALAETAYW